MVEGDGGEQWPGRYPIRESVPRPSPGRVRAMESQPHDRPARLLPPRSQPLIAAAVATALVALAGWFAAAGGLTGGLVHHDRPPVADHRFTVNVNTAAEVELAQLPGIGPTMARRIVDHRREHGPFASVEALLDVPGIGPTTLERLRPHLRPLGGPRPRTPPAGP
jgi:competence ComEA-like helix-hairpin-helix protein